MRPSAVEAGSGKGPGTNHSIALQTWMGIQFILTKWEIMRESYTDECHYLVYPLKKKKIKHPSYSIVPIAGEKKGCKSETRVEEGTQKNGFP